MLLIYQSCFSENKTKNSILFREYINFLKLILSVTAIHTRKYLVSSDPRSQAGNGAVSTAVGDHAGILRAVVFAK